MASVAEDAALLSETHMTYSVFDMKPGDAAYRNPNRKQTVIDSKTGQKKYEGKVIFDAMAFFMRGDAHTMENFNSNFRPKNNGAFLTKNSWGSGGGFDGYKWISYEDGTMCDACCITGMDADFYKKPLKIMT